MRTLRYFAVVMVAACGGMKPVPDSGTPIDSSCGIDCAAQTTFGLLPHTCFEYSSANVTSSPPDFAAEVEPVVTLENDVKVMQVLYTQGGQHLMQDSFTIEGTTLKLVRREWGTGNSSVSYETAANVLDGVDWLKTDSNAGETYTTMTTARVVGASAGTDGGTYSSITSAPTGNDLHVPLKTYDSGLRMVFGEIPEHGSDGHRVFVPGTGFIFISTTFSQGDTDTSKSLSLQNVKNTVDAGACGF